MSGLDGGVTETAPAKINLFLRLTGKRDDGYHLLDSLVGFTEYGDSLIAEPAEDLTLSIDGPFSPVLAVEPDNLVLRAARALQKATGTSHGAHLTLTKRLPIASGIGGGSSDAAACLRALCQVWDLDLDPSVLAEIGLTLGADIPVCIAARPARMTGVGEQVEPVAELPGAVLLLVNPGIALATAPVFRMRSGPFSQAFGPLPRLKDAAALADLVRRAGNDLTLPAKALCPAVTEVLTAIEAQPDCLVAAMSGSGATCFGVFADLQAAERARDLLRQSHPWWVCATRLRSN
jgi:4-diphosphocytidyl-2-C-methyl-D-erythritol kinase